MWQKATLIIDKAVQFATAKNLFSDAVLCLGNTNQEPVNAWESKVKWLIESRYLRELDRLDGESMGFLWNIFQDSRHRGFSLRFKR